MQTEAIFENISERIIKEIDSAQHSIYIAVAWFTNRKIFEKLLTKTESCKIQIIISNDDINNNSFIDFDILEKKNGKIFKVGNGDSELMHNKFCVIDYNTIITGSYNWSYKAENNFENIIIHSDDTTLANQFVNEFKQIVKKSNPNDSIFENDFPLDKIIKRLEIIKNLIILEEIEEINTNSKKLNDYFFNEDLKELTNSIYKREFSKAIIQIQNFISNYQQISIWNDPEISSLKLEIKLLESQINAFENEKTDIEKVINDFNHRHTIELGKVILEILLLRKVKYKDINEKAKEAEEDFENYKNNYNTEVKREVFEITIEEKILLKKAYKNASILCHPDKFINEPIEVQKQAEELFKELNNANSKNDIKRVSDILENLEKGILNTNTSNKINDKTQLTITLKKLKTKLNQIKESINELKENQTYLTIKNIPNWDNYFTDNFELLKKELFDLKNGK